LPTSRHRCNLDVWALAQSRRDGHGSLVTPKRVLNEYNKDLIFFENLIQKNRKKYKKLQIQNLIHIKIKT